MTGVRLDKWLWAARFYKTRTLASQAVEAGQVRVGDERVKPAHAVRVGESITVRKAGFTWQVAVTAVSDHRGGAAEAALLYRESEASVAAREELAGAEARGVRGQPALRGTPDQASAAQARGLPETSRGNWGRSAERACSCRSITKSGCR